MGSLVPGWDTASPGVPPKDLQDHTDDQPEEKEGYFARYERQKSLKRDSRGSKDQQEDSLDARPNLATRSWSPPLAPGGPPSAAAARSLRTQSSAIPYKATRAGSLETELDVVLNRSRTSPVAVPYTRRTNPPRSPRGVGPASPEPMWSSHSWGAAGMSAPEADLSRYQTGKKSEAWWRKLSSSRLNELPDEGDANAWKRSPYLPQHHVVGQKMQYIVSDKPGCGGAEQKEKEMEGPTVGTPNLLPVH